MTPASPDDQHNAFIPRLLTRLVAAVCRAPRTVLIVSAVISLVSAWEFYARLEYRTQRSDLMNPHKDYQKRWRAYLSEFGDDDDMVVVVEGANRDCMTAALEHLAIDVRSQPERFDRLFYKVDLRPLRDRALLF